MALTYGFLKCKVISEPMLRPSRHEHELQYHLHASFQSSAGDKKKQVWDAAINVGTNDADDLLKYKLAFDFQHPILETLRAADEGFTDLTATRALPALDFLRSTILDQTGVWRDSDAMDGSEQLEPVASLLRLLRKARSRLADIYIFGRPYSDRGRGIHDIHMNQGSTSDAFLNNGEDDHHDHNAIWQNGAVIVEFGQPEAAAYFTAFTHQMVPTDDLGNPITPTQPSQDADVRRPAR